MKGITNQVKVTAKAAAIKTAQQMANEPLELLKKTREQAIPFPETADAGEKKENSEPTPEEIAKKNEQAMRLKAAYDAELADISNKREEKEAVRQRDFATQMEGGSEQETAQPLVEPTNKPKRGLFSGVKTRLQRMKQKVENRLPPSG